MLSIGEQLRHVSPPASSKVFGRARRYCFGADWLRAYLPLAPMRRRHATGGAALRCLPPIVDPVR